MNVNITIYGYTHDAGAYHPSCLDGGVDPSNDPGVDAIFSWMDDGEGLSCDSCFDWIFEPDEVEDEEEGDGLVLIAGVLYDEESLEEA